MATQTNADRLRSLLGEVIPDGGTDADSLLSDDEVADLLSRHGTVDKALPEAWGIKAAKLSNLVDVTEGDQRRSLSQAHRQALEMTKHYGDTGGASGGRTRINRIVRTGFSG